MNKCNMLCISVMLGACIVMFGCTGPTSPVMDVVTTPPPTTTTPDESSNEVITTNQPDIIETKTELEHTVYEHNWEAITDTAVQQQIDDTIQWVKDNCDRSFQTGTPPVVQILFTTRNARTDYIDYLHDRLEHWHISDNRIHDVDDTYYYFLEFTVNRDDATVYANCIGLFE